MTSAKCRPCSWHHSPILFSVIRGSRSSSVRPCGLVYAVWMDKEESPDQHQDQTNLTRRDLVAVVIFSAFPLVKRWKRSHSQKSSRIWRTESTFRMEIRGASFVVSRCLIRKESSTLRNKDYKDQVLWSGLFPIDWGNRGELCDSDDVRP